MSSQPVIMPGRNWLDSPHIFFANLVARLRPGVTRERASAVLTPVAFQITQERARDIPESTRRRIQPERLDILPLASGLSSLRERFSKPLHVLFAMVGMGLLLACVNVMSLQFARAGERRRELSVRLAIGAGRARIVRQLLTESLALALLGGALGLALCRPAASAVVGLISMAGQPVRLDVAVDWRMLGFVMGLSCLAAMVCGILPALRVTGRGLSIGLQQGSRGTSAAPARRVGARAAAAVQLGLSVVLISGALLFAFSLERLTNFDTGIARRGLIVLDLDFLEAGYKGEQTGPASLRLLERLRALSDVRAASFSGVGIYTNRGANGPASSDTVKNQAAWMDRVGPGYFTALGTRLTSGRDFDDRDNGASEKVAVLSTSFARHFFPGIDPVGRNVYLPREHQTYRVIGVAADIRNNIRSSARRTVYLAQAQSGDGLFTTRFLLRAAGSASGLAGQLRPAVRAENPAIRVISLDYADDLLNRTLDLDRVVAALSFAFGLLAVTLAAVGVYGMLAHDVARRTAEIGIRMAVGATRSNVLGLVLREAALVASVGIVVGLTGALALGHVVEGLVFELKPGDPRVLGTAVAGLALVALAAALGPARRAAAMDPMRALRSE
jgi:predicted permease